MKNVISSFFLVSAFLFTADSYAQIRSEVDNRPLEDSVALESSCKLISRIHGSESGEIQIPYETCVSDFTHTKRFVSYFFLNGERVDIKYKTISQNEKFQCFLQITRELSVTHGRLSLSPWEAWYSFEDLCYLK